MSNRDTEPMIQETLQETTDILDIKEQAKIRKAERRSKRNWRIFLYFYTVIFLIIGLVGCIVLYKYMDAYEQSRPENTMNAFMENTKEEDWENYLLSGSNLVFSNFDNAEKILHDYYSVSCEGKNKTYMEAVNVSTNDVPVYNVKAGASYICRVYLTQEKPLPFGFRSWKVARVEGYLPESTLASVTVSIEVPTGTKVTINGIEVGSEYKDGTDIPYSDLTPLEQQYETVPTRSSYRVAGLLGDIKVEADGKEVLPSADSNTNAEVFYSVESPQYSFEVTAPKNVLVFCNDVQLTNGVDNGDGILKGFESYTGNVDPSATVTYTMNGLYCPPVLTASSVDGKELKEEILENGTTQYTYAGTEDLKDQYVDTVDYFFSCYIYYGAGSESMYSYLLNCILPGTSLYTYVEDSTAAMIWASDTSVSFEYLEYTDFYQWSDTCFTCRVSYKADMYASAWYESYGYELENAYDLIFVYSNGKWLAASMNIVV